MVVSIIQFLTLSGSPIPNGRSLRKDLPFSIVESTSWSNTACWIRESRNLFPQLPSKVRP